VKIFVFSKKIQFYVEIIGTSYLNVTVTRKCNLLFPMYWAGINNLVTPLARILALLYLSASSCTEDNQLIVWTNYSGVANVLPELSETHVNAVNDRLQKLGVRNRDDLQQHVTEGDLIKDSLLNEIQARRLLKSWQKENDKNATGIFITYKKKGRVPLIQF